MKILFLDDRPARKKWATEHFPDHDLGGEMYAESSRTDAGFEAVRWFVRQKPPTPEIVVHTRNAPAGLRKTGTLRKAGYSARYRSFDRLVNGLPAKERRSTSGEGRP